MYKPFNLLFIYLLIFPQRGEYKLIYSIPSKVNHAIYISIVEIEHQDLGNNAKIKIKVFTDDFKDAMMNASQKRIEFSKGQTCSDYKSVIEGYFDKHFKTTINGNFSEYHRPLKIRYGKLENVNLSFLDTHQSVDYTALAGVP